MKNIFDEFESREVTGYFNYKESFTHLSAKEKLFELIKSRRVTIKDQFNEEYDIFKGKFNHEFLHLESFVMDYSNRVLFSNYDSPCKELKNFTPLCKQEGYMGAFEELPCAKCILSNFGDIKKSSRYASFRPDISFGYDGLHKVWLEIKHTHESTYNKLRFCYENDIILLEIDTNVIEEFNDYNGELVFERLIYEPVEIDLSKYEKFIESNLNEKGYILSVDLKRKINKNLFEYTFNKLARYDIYNQLINKYNLIEVFDDNRGVMEYFGFKGKKKILIQEKDIPKIERIKEEYNIRVNERINNIIDELVSEINKNGYMLLSDFKSRLSKSAPKGHKSNFNYKEIFKENKLIDVYTEECMEYLIKLGFHYTKIKKKVLLPQETYDNLNE